MTLLNKFTASVRFIHVTSSLQGKVPKNLKNKSHSSQLWLTRQLRDPFVELAKVQNYRCRSAFKLLEVNERFRILKAGQVVVDCGAAPGSWTQVAVKHTNSNGETEGPRGLVCAIDKQSIYPIEGAQILGNMDFTTTDAQDQLLKLLNFNKADVVLSDMAPNATGTRDLDHDNIMKLAYAALKFALHITKPGGTFLVKVWDGSRSKQFMEDLKTFYASVRIVRPEATRSESAEKFFLAREFKGLKTSQ